MPPETAVPGRRVAAGGVSLWVEREGDGVPLLLIAGLGYACWCWRELREALRGEADVVAFDNRGAGRSDKPDGPYSIALLADDAAAVLEAEGLRDAHVLGHSMGGYIAQTLALRHPERVRSLVLVGTSPGGPGTAPVPQETLEVWKLAGTLPPAEYARRSMPKSFAPGWTERHPQEFERVLARRLEFPTPAANWRAQFDACVEFVAQGAAVEAIRQPALVIHGEEDRVVPHENGVLLARRLPRGRLESLPNTGHLPMLEDPRGFAARVRAHLSRAGTPS